MASAHVISPHTAAFEIVPVRVAPADIARIAYRTYGKGRHSAGLHCGDCFTCALAKATGRI